MQPYKKLLTYWYSVVIYDHTVEFCSRWIESWKLKEQMNGAARSGKQNIVEGSDDMGISFKIAIKLTGIAKGSLEELIGDVEDYLRQNKFEQWSRDDLRTKKCREKSNKLIRDLCDSKNPYILKKIHLSDNPEVAANWLLTLCHQATYLLHRQVEALKKKHETEGGVTEQLYRKRKEYRKY